MRDFKVTVEVIAGDAVIKSLLCFWESVISGKRPLEAMGDSREQIIWCTRSLVKKIKRKQKTLKVQNIIPVHLSYSQDSQ